MTMTPSPWQDRPVLITGATGLVGGWLIERLLDHKAEVVCLVRDWVPQSRFDKECIRDRVRVVHGDVRDLGTVERAIGEYEINTVFHLAAQTIVGIANRNPVSTFESNIQGTWNVLESCRRAPTVKAVVIASSDKAYGEHNTLPYDEDQKLGGSYPYDVSKSCVDLIGQSYGKTYNLPVAITRCGNFYGGGDLNWNRIIPGTIRSVIRGERPIIRSDGKFVRDYFYVEDGAAAYMLLAEKLLSDESLKGQAFNFSNEIQQPVWQLVQHIIYKMGWKNGSAEILNQASNEIRHQYLSAQKARKVLGWSPLFTLDQGLERTIDWYRKALAT